MKVNIVSIRAVEDLAVKGLKIKNSETHDDLDKYVAKSSVAPSALQKAISQQLKARDEEVVQTAASIIIDLMDETQSSIDSHVESLREVRRQQNDLLSKIKVLDRAKKYGAETSNYIPLMVAMGHMFPSQVENPDLLIIPEDWVPSDEKKKTVAPK